MLFIFTPVLAWFVTGCTKFVINCFRSKKISLKHIGYGGFPSNHSAIVNSCLGVIFFNQGMGELFLIAFTLAFVVMMDANGLRKIVEIQARTVNQLIRRNNLDVPLVRERVGHSKFEIVGGAVLGWLVAYFLTKIF